MHASHGLRGKLRPEVPQELRRRVVHPVHVVEDEQRGRVEEVTEERSHDAVQARAPERRVEIVHLGRGLDLDVERRRQERRPRHELLVDLLQPLAEDRAIVLGSAVQLDVEQRAEERSERVVRSRGLVLLAAQFDLPHVGAVLPQLLGEARLPDPGLADELDERSEAHAHRCDGRAEHCPFPLAIDERQLVLSRGALAASRVQREARRERTPGRARPFP